MEKFDYQFYLDLYPDLRKAGIKTEEKAYKHYLLDGNREGRICHPDQMKENIEKAYKKIEKGKNSFERKKEKEEKINILIRTSNRPEYCKKCIESIVEQQYCNYNIIICYDKIESLSYLDDYKENEKIQYFYVEVESKEKYKFNLYCNILMDKVEEGWILFLDDDDKLTHNKVLPMLNENIESSEDSLYIWKFLRPDKIIYPKNVNHIELGDIDTTCVCFHHKHKDKSRWPDKQYGDFSFFSGFINNHSFTKIFIDNIFTQTINESVIGNFGE